jgi:hypothetical protein
MAAAKVVKQHSFSFYPVMKQHPGDKQRALWLSGGHT